MTSTISIAICTYNPDRRLLSRLLTAIHRLERVGLVDRIVIIDNNSDPPLLNTPEVETFLSQQPQAVCLRESKPGLTAARCRAIQETSSDVVVFFDDDNEPAPDYLVILLEAFDTHSGVGVWGPGMIKVEFIDKTPADIRRRPEAFQERTKGFGYVFSPGVWNDLYPYGTGFAVRRAVLQSYVTAVEVGRLKSTDRIGKSLASAGDLQILWESFEVGLCVGLLSSLRCGHIINGEKANHRYLERLQFGIASTSLLARVEYYPESKETLPNYNFAFVTLIKIFVLQLSKQVLRPATRIDNRMGFAAYLGGTYGEAVAASHPSQKLILKAAKWLGYV
jgi:glycosyltransferase involved in cell wall biosynthesis